MPPSEKKIQAGVTVAGVGSQCFNPVFLPIKSWHLPTKYADAVQLHRRPEKHRIFVNCDAQPRLPDQCCRETRYATTQIVTLLAVASIHSMGMQPVIAIKITTQSPLSDQSVIDQNYYEERSPNRAVQNLKRKSLSRKFPL